MADGFRCKYCGWQETNHGWGAPNEGEETSIKLPGYRFSLDNCQGFELSKRDQRISRRLEEARLEEGQIYAERERVYAEVFPLLAPDFLRWVRLGMQLHPEAYATAATNPSG